MAKPKIEYTPEMRAAMMEVAATVNKLEALAHFAGLKSLKVKVVWGKGGSLELECKREWDKNALPYDAPVAL